MQSDAPLTLFSLLLGLFCVSSLVEHSLYGGFNRMYYTHGLPFVILRIPVAAHHQDIPTASLLGAQFRSDLIGSLVFWQIAPDTYGFRRQFFQWALFPINMMHGMLLFDREHGRVVLKGFFNVSVPLLILVIGIFLMLGPFPWLVRLLAFGVVGLAIGTPLLMELHRCARLASFAASSWKTIPEKATTL
jgi:small-conductance mechanosensitive channel